MNRYVFGLLLKSFLVIFFAIPFKNSAAQNEQALFAKIETELKGFRKSDTTARLFLHLDKSTYITMEQIWFTAYLLKSNHPADEHHTLYVFVCDEFHNKILARQKFVMAGGIAYGNLQVNDTIPSGNYYLVAYTNLLTAEPTVKFEQRLHIRAEKEDPYNIEIESYGNSKKSNDSIYLNALLNPDNKELFGAKTKLKYAVVAGADTLYKRTVTLEANRQFVIPIPINRIGYNAFSLITESESSGIYFSKKTAIPINNSVVNLRWFPEGGSLVNGLPGKIAFEARYSDGRPASMKFHLLENKKELIEFNSNKAGMGVINILPDKTHVYGVISDDSSIILVNESFPKPLENGYVMKVEKAVTNDSIHIDVFGDKLRSKVYLLAHNYQQGFYLAQNTLYNRKAGFDIEGSKLPAGLITLTLFDSSFQPVAERTVYSGWDKQFHLQIFPDSAKYHPNSKTQWKLHASDPDGNPVKASVSVALVFKKRIDSLSYQDIVSYNLFTSYREHKQVDLPVLFSMGTKEDMEQFLLTSCWSRYAWQNNPPAIEQAFSGRSLSHTGYVLYRNKKPKRPVSLLLVYSDGRMTQVQTDSTGSFTLKPDQDAVEPDSVITIIINEKAKINYSIVFSDEPNKIAASIAHQPHPVFTMFKGNVEEEAGFISRYRSLTEVIVTSKKYAENDMFGVGKRKKANQQSCRDYVCMYNYVNCRIHPNYPMKPVIGERYYIDGKIKTYKGCTSPLPLESAGKLHEASLMYKVSGRYYAKEFYSDSSGTALSENFSSTVYWNPQILTDDNGDATINFQMNDLTGAFIFIAQGITANGVLSGKKTVMVIK